MEHWLDNILHSSFVSPVAIGSVAISCIVCSIVTLFQLNKIQKVRIIVWSTFKYYTMCTEAITMNDKVDAHYSLDKILALHGSLRLTIMEAPLKE